MPVRTADSPHPSVVVFGSADYRTFIDLGARQVGRYSEGTEGILNLTDRARRYY